MIDYESLKEDYAILDGMPDELVMLNAFINCGMLACGLGWLMQHPKYTGQGYRFDGQRVHPPGGLLPLSGAISYGHIASTMYGVTEQDGKALFGPRLSYLRLKYDPVNYLRPEADKREEPLFVSDKQFLLARIRNFLTAKGQL